MNDEYADDLISQTIDCESGAAQWNEFANRADAEPRLWRQLAESQRDELGLIRTMAGAAVVADAVAAPSIALHREPACVETSIRVRQWSGWAVAALVAIAALIRGGLPTQAPPNSGMQQANFGLPIQSAADAFNSYIEKGKETGAVVGEIPAKVLVETRPAASGKGYELLYLRQVLERTVVPDLYQVNGQDELGQPMLIRYQRPVRNSM
jgi:hypothetical protein